MDPEKKKDPPDKPAETKAPTDEQLAARAEEIMQGMGFAPPTPKLETEPEKKPEPEKKDEKDEKGEGEGEGKGEAAPATPPAAEKKEEKPPVTVPPPITEAIDPKSLKPPPPPPEPEAPAAEDLDDDDQETIDALARMERDGKAPKGIVDRTKKFWAAEAEYITKWQAEHPGEQFDLNSSEHSDFYEKHEPAYDEREFKKAQKLNLKEGIKREVAEEVKKETAAEEHQRKLREQAPRTAAAAHDAMKQMVADAGFKDEMTKDGALVLDKDVETKIDKASPHARAILIEEAELLTAQVAEIDKIKAFGDKYELKPDFSVKTKSGAHVLVHRMLTDFAETLEGEMAKLPPESTMREGRRFVTNDQFAEQLDGIMKSPGTNTAKQAAIDKLVSNYYTLGWDDIQAALIAKHSGRARTRIDQLGGFPGRKGKPDAAQTAQPAKTEERQESAGSTTPPSVDTSSDNVDTRKTGSVVTRKTSEEVEKAMWG